MEEEEVEVTERRRLQKRHVAFGFLFLILLLAVIIWTQRTRIATDFIERELARRGVQASYEVARIGFRTQQLENVVIGDPDDPDLTARFVEVKLPLISVFDPQIGKITARGVRLFGRLVDGAVTFGEVDKLLPPRTGAPFRFPDQEVDIADAALALSTPGGLVAISVEGQGNLADGFRGEMAALSRELRVSGCTLDQPVGYAEVAINDRRVTLDGPFQADSVVCPEQGIEIAGPLVDVEGTVPETLDSWLGAASIEADRARIGDNALGPVRGRLSFRGDSALTRGAVDIAAAQTRLAGTTAERISLDGNYAFSADRGQLSLVGDAAAADVIASNALSPVAEALSGADGTPVEPIGDALAAAVTRFGSGFDARGSLRLVNGPGSGAVRIERLSAVSGSGARLALDGGEGVTYYWPAGTIRADGDFALTGGGFPSTRVSLNQPRGGAPIRGEARIAPMVAGGASLTLAPIRFGPAPGGATRIETTAVIDGPFNDGRVAGLVVPISGRFGAGGFAFGERCTTVGFRALQAAGLRLGPTRLPLCPTGNAILWQRGGGPLQGGAEIRSPRLSGQLGDSPITLVADRVRFGLADPGFTSTGVEIRLGGADAVQRLDLDALNGRFTSRGVVGTFAGGSGKLANVPLLLSDMRGEWSVIGGDLEVEGALTVADAADPPRFYPLVSNDFRLTLIDGEIDAGGWLTDPETGTRVTEVTIDHTLETGTGQAVLDVPGIRFDEDYQPEELTRLTTGVIALVDGTVQGQGRINWGPQGTTSTGTFSTEEMNLAAPFGPVTGLTTTIEFTDLLGLVSAPGQLAHVDLIQAGIDVVDGDIRYQLLPDLRVRVESGTWPFMGGQLFLADTTLDFSQPSTKRLVFRIVGLDAAIFVQEMEFSNIAATGTFDGVVPMEFDVSGGRIVGGRLEARPPGGTLSYIGVVTEAQLGTYGKMAFDALKSLAYEKFTIDLNGSLEGEFLAGIELDGIARNVAPQGGIAGYVLGQLAKIPFEFNIAIRGPFRSLIGTARSFEDPSDLIQPVLPEVLQGLETEATVITEEKSETQTQTETPTTIQPEESEGVQ